MPFKQITKLSPAEEKIALSDAKARGLPEGWSVVWESVKQNKGRRCWISPDGKRKCTGIPEALALSVKMGLLSADKLPKNYKRNRVLTEQEIAQALDDARRKGLPKGWTVMWGINENKRIWVSPNGQRKCNSLPKALAVSYEMGLVSADKVPSKYKPDRTLSDSEKVAALKKAGLPNSWGVQWDKKEKKKVWITPGGKKCTTVHQALAIAVDSCQLAADKVPKSFREKVWREIKDMDRSKSKRKFPSIVSQEGERLKDSQSLSSTIASRFTQSTKRRRTEMEVRLELDRRAVEMNRFLVLEERDSKKIGSPHQVNTELKNGPCLIPDDRMKGWDIPKDIIISTRILHGFKAPISPTPSTISMEKVAMSSDERLQFLSTGIELQAISCKWRNNVR